MNVHGVLVAPNTVSEEEWEKDEDIIDVDSWYFILFYYAEKGITYFSKSQQETDPFPEISPGIDSPKHKQYEDKNICGPDQNDQSKEQPDQKGPWPAGLFVPFQHHIEE